MPRLQGTVVLQVPLVIIEEKVETELPLTVMLVVVVVDQVQVAVLTETQESIKLVELQ